jgi:hypothetical protein
MKNLNLFKKNDGSTLLVAIVVSSMLLTLGIGAARLLVKDVEFAADFLFSEKAYFAAESGIETALLELKTHPVQNMEDYEVKIDDYTKSILNLSNNVTEFDFDLSPSNSQKFRLIKDIKPNDEYETTFIDSFDLIVSPTGETFQWKFLCKNNDNKTMAKVKSDEISQPFNDFFTESSVTLSNWIGDEKIDAKTCFFSVQNLSDKVLNFKFINNNKMTPNKTHVHAVGKAGKREKHISFDYTQSNLGAIFDFVLFHTDKGL